MTIDTSIKLANDLPGSIKAYSYPDDDGNIYICINEHLSDEVRIEALLHELRHVLLNHFASGQAVNEIEGRK